MRAAICKTRALCSLASASSSEPLAGGGRVGRLPQASFHGVISGIEERAQREILDRVWHPRDAPFSEGRA